MMDALVFGLMITGVLSDGDSAANRSKSLVTSSTGEPLKQAASADDLASLFSFKKGFDSRYVFDGFVEVSNPEIPVLYIHRANPKTEKENLQSEAAVAKQKDQEIREKSEADSNAHEESDVQNETLDQLLSTQERAPQQEKDEQGQNQEDEQTQSHKDEADGEDEQGQDHEEKDIQNREDEQTHTHEYVESRNNEQGQDCVDEREREKEKSGDHEEDQGISNHEIEQTQEKIQQQQIEQNTEQQFEQDVEQPSAQVHEEEVFDQSKIVAVKDAKGRVFFLRIKCELCKKSI